MQPMTASPVSPPSWYPTPVTAGLPDPGTPPDVHRPGQLCVRDALFLLAHDEYRRFSPRVIPAVLELGLAAATLIDLVLAHRVRISQHGNIHLVSHQPVTDVVAQTALETLRARTPALPGGSLPMAEALAALAPGLTERSRAHLVARGLLLVHRRRFRRTRYTPATSLTMGAGVTAPRMAVLDRIADPHGLALCALVQALQIHDALYLAHRTHLDPQLTYLVEVMRQLDEPMNAIPRITDALRTEVDNRIVGVYR